jgi:hypothetical protein
MGAPDDAGGELSFDSFQRYAANPEKIPISPDVDTMVIDGPESSEGPYR